MVMLVVASLAIFAQTGEGAEPFKITWQMVVAIVAGVYEVIARVVPTVGNWSITGKIIEALKWLSDFLNRKSEK